MLDLTAGRPVWGPSKPLRAQWLGTFLSAKYSTLFSKVLFCCSLGCNLSRNNKSPRVYFPRLRTPCTFSASKAPLLHRPGALVWRASPKITPYRCNPHRHLYRNPPSPSSVYLGSCQKLLSLLQRTSVLQHAARAPSVESYAIFLRLSAAPFRIFSRSP